MPLIETFDFRRISFVVKIGNSKRLGYLKELGFVDMNSHIQNSYNLDGLNTTPKQSGDAEAPAMIPVRSRELRMRDKLRRGMWIETSPSTDEEIQTLLKEGANDVDQGEARILAYLDKRGVTPVTDEILNGLLPGTGHKFLDVLDGWDADDEAKGESVTRP